MPNALAGESSPYLRQHQENPVDWLPWGEEALRRARDRDRPLLVSIGYSACHWCHVMERESFEDPGVAALMNEEFVCVKVDREERPDIDAIYMEAVQVMTGHGGWPLNVFLTPELSPFYGGTYFPPEPRHGMPAFSQVLQAVAEAWREGAGEIRVSGERLRERLSGGAQLTPSTEPLDRGAIAGAVSALERSYDERHGGFGGAPKFPQTPVIEFLMAHHRQGTVPEIQTGAARMALQTLRAMAGGGIYDQLGGGFHRYAVDEHWTVPHFEKMLYDNALLARAYLNGFKLCGEPRLLEVCLQTLEWALREMRGPEGGFYSALDADSEGVEGRFYLWNLASITEALGDDATVGIDWLGVSEHGNFTDPHHPEPGLNVLSDRGPRPDPATRQRIRHKLLEARQPRVRPDLDDKRLTSWNALMISALAETGAYLQSAAEDSEQKKLGEQMVSAAVQCAEFILEQLRREDGRLLRVYTPAGAKLSGYLEDYAFLLEALLALYEATFQERWFALARELAEEMIDLFSDSKDGGFFSTASDHEQLFTRRKDLEDSPIPAGSSSAALALLRLSALSGERIYEEQALGVLRLEHEIATRHPQAFGHLLRALQFHLEPVRQVAIVGSDRAALERVVRRRTDANMVLAAFSGEPGAKTIVGLLEGRTPIEGSAVAYVCEHFSCRAPTSDPSQLATLLT
ncbi:MAG TPA: thioredoxin domain-containing protein [Solirubrobacteraceae bacterium]|jgi:hypothetical protein